MTSAPQATIIDIVPIGYGQVIVTEVLRHVHQIRTHGSNIILIAEGQLTLVDTGLRGSAGTVLKYLRCLGRHPDEIALIILSHYHLDHSGSLAALRQLSGARVAAHKQDAFYIRHGIIDPRLGPNGPWNRKWFRTLAALQPAAPVDIELEGGEKLAPLGGLEVIHTPGHTPGSISLYAPGQGLLIVGDALINRRHRPRVPIWIINHNTAQAWESARKLSGLDCKAVCFGHGRPLTEDAPARLAQVASRA